MAVVAFVVAGACLCRAPMPLCAQEAIPVGHYRQLFVDDHLIAERSGVELTLHQPTKCPDNPVLRAEHPWESKGVAIYGTVLYDDEEALYKMWYRAIDDTCYACYATSADGIHWEKPVLNAMPHKGSTANNIVLGSKQFYIDGFAVIKDQDEWDPSRRYKMLTYNGDRRFAAMISPDGLHWSGPINSPQPHDTGDVISMYFDTALDRYVGLLKRRYVYEDDQGRETRKRARLIAFSEDFSNWSEPEWALVPDEQDPPTTELYSHVAYMYQGLRIGYVTSFEVATERIDTELCTSRDGVKWQRYRERAPFIPNGPPGSCDAGMALADASGLVIRDDKIWIYYLATNYDHEGRTGGEEPAPSGIALAQLRLDGFVSADAGPDGGTLLTKPLLCSGRALRINADAPDGEVRAELLAADGGPIAGYDLASSQPFTGDSVNSRLHWGNDGNPVIVGDPVAIHFHLKNAKLYSFWFAHE